MITVAKSGHLTTANFSELRERNLKKLIEAGYASSPELASSSFPVKKKLIQKSLTQE